MAAPHPRLRKALSTLGRLKTIRQRFAAIPPPRGSRSVTRLSEALRAGLAVFGLTYPSFLKFDEARREGVIRHHLKRLVRGRASTVRDAAPHAAGPGRARAPAPGVSGGASGAPAP